LRVAERRGSLVRLKCIHGSNEFESAAEKKGLLRQATAKREERALASGNGEERGKAVLVALSTEY